MANERNESKAGPALLEDPDSEPTQIDYDRAMRRLVYLAGVGAGFIVLFAAGSSSIGAALNVVGIALMLGGAALTTGGLLGFLFGIPYAQPLFPPAADDQADAGTTSLTPDQQGGPRAERPRYRPNSNLEQVSDWLTKIIVGVGLVQFNAIVTRVWDFAGYVAMGIGSGSEGAPRTVQNLNSTRAFVCSVLVYFAVCGFVFGFLWARLYLLKWFSDADDVRKLRRTVLRLQEQTDAVAIAMATRQMNRGPSEPPINDQEIYAAIKSASQAVKAHIFDSVVGSADRKDATDVQLSGAISILRALIAADERGVFHRNHAQLSYALRRLKPPDWAEAISSISRAIEIRNASGSRGWRFYEFHRARCRIMQDGGVGNNTTTNEALKALIVRDLAAATQDQEGWKRWMSNDRDVTAWIELNNVSAAELTAAPLKSESTAGE